MRIESLTIQAFGPYLEKQYIDFTRLYAHPLFLIQGETGAGKTFLLDAVTYALYGKSSSGQRGDFTSMRCRLAKEESTILELIFTVAHKRYRFYREIKVSYRKQKEPRLSLYHEAGEWIDDVFHPFSENMRAKAMEEKAKEIIGLDHEQWIQVMILPQGKFERLLVSKSEEKQEILKTLFQTQRWEAICDILATQMQKAKEMYMELQQKETFLWEQYPYDSMEAFETALHEKAVALKKQQKQLQDLGQQRQQLQEMLVIQKRYEEQQEDRDQLQKQYDVLMLQQKNMEERKQAIEKEQTYLKIRPFVVGALQWEKQLLEVKKEKQLLLDEILYLQKQQQELQMHANTLPEKEQKCYDLQQRILQCKKEWEEAVSLAKAKEEYEQKEVICKKCFAAYQAIQQKRLDMETQLQKQQMEMEEIRKELKQYPSLLETKQKMEQSKQYLEQIQQQQMQQAKWDIQQKQAKQQLQKIIQKLQEQTVKIREAEALYMHNSAVFLADLLKEDEPCPVCGSLHHPDPAQVQKQQMDLKQIQKMKQEQELLQNKQHLQEAEIEKGKAQIQNLQEQCRYLQMQVEQAKEHIYQEDAYQQLLQQQSYLQDLEKKQDLLYENYQTVQKVIVADKKKEEELQTQYHNLQVEQKARMHRLSQNQQMRSDQKSIQQEITMLEKQYQTVKQEHDKIKEGLQKTKILLQQKQTQYETVCQKIIKCETAYQQEIDQITRQKEDYEQLKKWETSKRISQEEIQEYQAYQQQLLHIEKRLQEIAAETIVCSAYSYAQLQKEITELETTIQSLQAATVLLENEWQKETKGCEQLKHYQKKKEEKRMHFLKIERFVKEMRGDHGISIERYVLGVLLSSITQCANQLLQKVHDGRYQIFRSDETSGRTRKSGLEFAVYDAYSHSTRSVMSLSGGEKFLVSLALSLGLSTVVQSRSGGIEMDMMFIDEGFGSLDERSIEDALAILTSMSSNKGMIGIISHVEILKENLPYGIFVEKSSTGSSITLQD